MIILTMALLGEIEGGCVNIICSPKASQIKPDRQKRHKNIYLLILQMQNEAYQDGNV